MLYEKALLDRWTAYAVKKAAQEKLKEAMKEGMEKGMEKGAEQKSYEFVKNLINKFGFTDKEAASAAEVSTDFVKKIRASLKKKK